MDIRAELLVLADEKYRDFQAGLIPELEKEKFLGVRTLEIRKLAKRLIKEGTAAEFTAVLPHELFDEYQLHALVISQLKGFDDALAETERFLPYVNNWATCDQLRPAAFKGRQAELLPKIEEWLDSGECYKVRFGLEMLMLHFLGDCFECRYLEMAAAVKSEEYYVRMMQAWFFAEALAVRYEEAVGYIEGSRLEKWVHNKAIQKARESLKIPDERKRYLKELRR